MGCLDQLSWRNLPSFHTHRTSTGSFGTWARIWKTWLTGKHRGRILGASVNAKQLSDGVLPVIAAVADAAAAQLERYAAGEPRGRLAHQHAKAGL